MSIFIKITSILLGLTCYSASAADLSAEDGAMMAHQGQQLGMIADVPNEIISITLNTLGYKDLLKCMSVSKAWCHLGRQDKAQRLFSYNVNKKTDLSSLTSYLDAANTQKLSVVLKLIFEKVEDLEALNLTPSLVRELQLVTVDQGLGTNRAERIPLSQSFNNEQLTKLMSLDVVRNLTVLSVANSCINNVEPLTCLQKLHTLTFGSNMGLKTVAPISQLTTLRNLCVPCSFGFNYNSLSEMTNLESLNLSGGTFINGKFLQNLVNLKSLNVRSTGLATLEDILYLTSLKSLVLSGTKINDVSPLVALPGLQELAVDVQATGTPSFLYFSPVFVRAPMDGVQGLDELTAVNKDLKIIDTSKI